MGARSDIRLAWFADIFDEVSGIITDTEEMYSLATRHQIPWFPFTCYPDNIAPFDRISPIFSVPTDNFYKGTSMHVPDFTKIISYLRQNRINIIASNTPATMGVMAMAAAFYLEIPWVDIYHTDLSFYANSLGTGIIDSPFVRPLFTRTGLFYLKQYQKQADLIFVRTQEFRDQMIQKGIAESRIRFYRGGVNIEQWNPRFGDRNIWTRYETDPHRFISVFVGRITKVKGIRLALEIFARDEFREHEFFLIGDGPEKEEYERDFGRYPNIHFLGIRRGLELQQIYASADLYLLPSASETLGKTVLEAMASGTAVIVSDQGGPKDYVKDRVSGRIFRAGDQQDLERVLSESFQDKDIVRLMGAAAREAVHEHTDEKLFHDFTGHLAALLP